MQVTRHRIALRGLGLLVPVLLLSGCATVPDAFEQNARLGRGVNLGNALEAPREGKWGVTLQAEYFQLIKEAGFDSIRIPIRWSAHAADTSPYEIDPAFFARVDWAVEQALARGLAAVINMHHYGEIMKDPAAHRERFLSLWQQIAAHYRGQPDSVYFELLNEPNDELTAELWNEFLVEALRVVRETNPRRTVLIGTAGWGGLGQLEKIELPDDMNLVVTFHYYEPFHFTHQGAEWVGDSGPWLGTQWRGTQEEKDAVGRQFDRALAWAEEHDRPLHLGEFGAYSKADMDSRARWTAFVAREAEARGIPWAYWEFCAGFGVYDPGSKDWRRPLREALIPTP